MVVSRSTAALSRPARPAWWRRTATCCARRCSAPRFSRTRSTAACGSRSRPDLLTIQAHNPEQEEAEDQVEVAYKGEEIEIGFNVNYLLDALSAIEGDKVEIGLTDSNSSCLIHAPGTTHTRYVVMPMRL